MSLNITIQCPKCGTPVTKSIPTSGESFSGGIVEKCSACWQHYAIRWDWSYTVMVTKLDLTDPDYYRDGERQPKLAKGPQG